jgi:hypothetical protein
MGANRIEVGVGVVGFGNPRRAARDEGTTWAIGGQDLFGHFRAARTFSLSDCRGEFFGLT